MSHIAAYFQLILSNITPVLLHNTLEQNPHSNPITNSRNRGAHYVSVSTSHFFLPFWMISKTSAEVHTNYTFLLSHQTNTHSTHRTLLPTASPTEAAGDPTLLPYVKFVPSLSNLFFTFVCTNFDTYRSPTYLQNNITHCIN